MAGGGPGTTLGARIRQARKALGLTQRDLGRPSLSASYVSMIEHDRVRPSLATLQLLAGRLRLPLSALLDAPPPVSVRAAVACRRGDSLLRQHRFTEALEAFTSAAPPAEESADPRLRIRVALGRGQALAGLRQFDLAAPVLEEARLLAEELGDDELVAAAANAQGFLAFRARQFARARALYQIGIDRLRAAGVQDGELLGKLLSNLGRVYVELGLPAQALDALRQAIPLLSRAGDPAQRALLFFNLGVASERQQAFDEADRYLQQAEVLLRLHENLRLLGVVKRSAGILRLGQGRLDEAEADLQESLHLARRCGDDEGTAQTLVELARLEVRRGRADAARAMAAEAEAIARRIYDEAELGRAAAADGAALAAAGRLAEAALRLRDAEEIFERLEMAGELSAACRDLGFVYLALGQHEAAASSFARAFRLMTPAVPAPTP
ncbi:MAG: tetratricopeptide repeat protein [Armatimonadota bacterium]|nr:tetratricopeptide repeat protein [Armatimonadota bacterium]